MATILVIATPSDVATTYGYHWLKRFSRYAASRGHFIIFQKTPSLKTLYKAITTYNPRLVVANGHGGFKSLSTNDNVIIGIRTFDSAIGRKIIGQNPEWFRSRLVLLLTCNAGRELAPKLVDYGATAVLGFKEPFIFLSEERSSPERDKLAEPYFISLLQSAMQLVNGKTFGEACDATRKAFAYYRDLAEQRGDENSAKYLNWDLINIVCVGDSWSRL